MRIKIQKEEIEYKKEKITADKIRAEVSVLVLYREALRVKLNDVPRDSISDANFIWGRSNNGEQINC